MSDPNIDVDRIDAPWTDEQVAVLNRFQTGGYFHPFTCGRRDRHRHDEGVLIATRDGWECPAEDCDYTQTWAHAFMADQAWNDEQRRYRDELWAIATSDPEGT